MLIKWPRVIEARFTFDASSILEGSTRDVFLVTLLNFVCCVIRYIVCAYVFFFIFVFEDGFSGVLRSDLHLFLVSIDTSLVFLYNFVFLLLNFFYLATVLFSSSHPWGLIT